MTQNSEQKIDFNALSTDELIGIASAGPVAEPEALIAALEARVAELEAEGQLLRAQPAGPANGSMSHG